MRTYAPASPTVAADAAALTAEWAEAACGFGAMRREALHYVHNTRRQSRKK